jgi:hypothetical protein
MDVMFGMQDNRRALLVAYLLDQWVIDFSEDQVLILLCDIAPGATAAVRA